jgi:hypothetical protein
VAAANDRDWELVRALICVGVYPNFGERVAKDLYRTRVESRAVVHAGSMNSHRAIIMNARAPAGGRVGLGPMERTAALSFGESVASIEELDDVPEDYVVGSSVVKDDNVVTSLSGIEMSRFLCYQELQRVETVCYLRLTTIMDPLALVLLAPCGQRGGGTACLWRESLVAGSGSIVYTRLESLLEVEVKDFNTARVLDDVRYWIWKYLDWKVWWKMRKQLEAVDEIEQRDQERLGKLLIQEVSDIIRSRKYSN